MSKNSKLLWTNVRARIEAGEFPKVFVTRAGKLALDGSAAELPAEIAALYPENIRAAAELKAVCRKEQERVDHERLLCELAEKKAAREKAIAEFGAKRAWRLAGLFVDDFSTARYTWQEIADWLSWDAYNLRHNQASVAIVCDRGEEAEFVVDVSEHFANPCNDRVSTPSFETLARRLSEYVQMRRENASHNN